MYYESNMQMKFRTEITLPPYPFQIDYQSKIFGLGSCFVDNMRDKFDYYQFNSQINPFGTIFNPYSVRKTLENAVKLNFLSEKDLFFYQNTWKSYQLHSIFNHSDKNKLLENVNRKIEQANHFLQNSNVILITLGTAWIYRHKKTDEIVNNCHKIPQKEFAKELMTTTEIIDELNKIIKLSKSISRSVKILFTISPVRHLKDGFTENNLSKSRLTNAVHSVVNQQDVFYFPSYEIMMDDLRDYRFYKDDMLHPNNIAVDYIWQKLQKSLMSKETITISNQVEKIRKALQHRAFDETTTQHQAFLAKTRKQIEALQSKYEWMYFDEKKNYR